MSTIVTSVRPTHLVASATQVLLVTSSPRI